MRPRRDKRIVRTTVKAQRRHFYEQASSADKKLKLYEGHYHKLLDHLGKEDVVANMRG